jgi:hypothetical protein
MNISDVQDKFSQGDSAGRRLRQRIDYFFFGVIDLIQMEVSVKPA